MADLFRPKRTYLRRGITLILALLIISVIYLGVTQWNTYHRNLDVSDANLPPLPALSSSDRILVLSPHPDDETLGAGGLMAKARNMGIPVHVVFLTNGDGSLATRLLQDAHFVEKLAKRRDRNRPKNLYRQIALMRQKEALNALLKLHIAEKEVTFLGYPDGGTKKMWEKHWHVSDPFRSPYTKTDHSPYADSLTSKAPYSGQQVVQDLHTIMVKFKPTIVVTTNPYDTHPDHWAANAYLNATVAQLQLQQKYFSWADRIRNSSFIIHHGLWPVPHGYHPDNNLWPPAALMQIGIPWVQLHLSKLEMEEKATALRQYKSQLATTPQFLRGFLRRNELFAPVKIVEQEGRSWKEVTKDPQNDLPLAAMASSADINTVQMKTDGQEVLLVRLDLGGKPWRDLNYVITLHAVTAQSITLHRVTAFVSKKQQWTGAIISNNKDGTDNRNPVKVETNKSQVILEIPVTFLIPEKDVDTLYLTSASTLLRKRVLDQTPTQIVQLNVK